MPGTIEKLCVLCGKDVHNLKRSKDAQGNYYCAQCYADASNGVQSHQSAAPTFTPSAELGHFHSSAKSAANTHEKSIIVGGVILGLLVIISLTYFLFIRNYWERANREQILTLKSRANAFVRGNKLGDAKRTYEELFNLIGEHEIRDSELLHDVDAARSSLATITGKLDAAAAEEAKRLEKIATDEALRQAKLELAQREKTRAAAAAQQERDQQLERDAQQKRDEDEEHKKEVALQETVDNDPILSALADDNPMLRRCFEKLHKNDNDRSFVKTELDVLLTVGKITLSQWRYVTRWMESH